MPLLNDAADSDLPREKIYKYGAEALSNAELMAIFLSSGIVGRNVIEVAGDLLKKYGGLQELGRLPVAEYMNNKGIGLAKACKLAAAFELGSRLKKETRQAIPLNSPELIYDHFSHQMGNLPHESALVVTVDTRLMHTSTTTISSGSVNETSAHPREILRPVITRNAYAFILIHNHPSGDPSPSRADHRITQNLLEAARIMQIRFLDHVIMGRPAAGRAPYFSFRSSGTISD
ncbi:DNA repair protein RadC [Luteolibacter algae]|uniref:DNA repair protein RadC n=1 Tax=Luteolibacter algae TaxID=454151 RepID=A0ABW5D9S4_9BACT